MSLPETSSSISQTLKVIILGTSHHMATPLGPGNCSRVVLINFGMLFERSNINAWDVETMYAHIQIENVDLSIQ